MKIRMLKTWNWTFRFERKARSVWIGAYWKIGELNSHIWINFIPCFPLHIELRRSKCPRCDAIVKRTYIDTGGIEACCVHCAWSPEGCLCRFGKFGEPNNEPIPYESDHLDYEN